MEKLNVFAARLLPREDFVAQGHRACQGCAEVLAMRLVHKALGRNTIVASATGCMEIITSPYPETAWKVPWIHVAFENSASVISGVEAGYKALMRKGRYPKRKINFVAYGGDGATMDIGLQWLSGAVERGHDMIYVCYDNEAYMNTGIQRSSATPFGASTTTSPAGKVSIGQTTQKKNMPEIMAAHHIPYVATINPSYPFDLFEKVRKAAATPGPAYLHAFSACPTGWRMAPEKAVQIGRVAVETGVFPLYEVENGRYRITLETPQLRPMRDYLKPQGRFRHLSEDLIDEIEKRVHREYRELAAKVRVTNEEDRDGTRQG
ncbi:MAG: pyruvate synthase subunit PorB [Deltaproteobacteria bacterium]|nr:pyruvate synthase subunit PorB [Deltaproteobacteria bacterium]